MSKRIRTTLGVVFSAIGAGLVYIGFNDYYSASADSAASSDFWYISFIMIITGAFVLLTGVISLIFVFATTKN